jgi:Cu+-exporting ATPase
MTVDPATAAATSEYDGKTFSFCAVGCRNGFDASPADFVGDSAASADDPG